VTDAVYFEDVSVGDSVDLGTRGVARADIVEFGNRWDPQDIHTDEEAAADSEWGGLIASGWHVAAVTMRLLVDGFLGDAATMGALGVDELRWRAPVRPGDELAASLEVVGTEDWEPRPGQGLVRARLVATNQREETVLTMVGLVLFERRQES
jgi:acyl dehydratase